MKSNKSFLLTDLDLDFSLVGIVTGLKSYRLCWFLNKVLNTSFARLEDISLNDKKRGEEFLFSIYHFEDEINKTEYSLISNKESGNFLIRELKQVDFLLILRGDYSSYETDTFIEKIAMINSVQAAFKIEPSSIKEIENLLF